MIIIARWHRRYVLDTCLYCLHLLYVTRFNFLYLHLSQKAYLIGIQTVTICFNFWTCATLSRGTWSRASSHRFRVTNLIHNHRPTDERCLIISFPRSGTGFTSCKRWNKVPPCVTDWIKSGGRKCLNGEGSVLILGSQVLSAYPARCGI